MHWTAENTLFDYSVFVVWKMMYINLEKTSLWKECVVMNIRALNKIMKLNMYSLLLQSDIILAVWDALYILTVNCTDFFY